MSQTITILTAPLPRLRSILKHPFRALRLKNSLGGHYAVTSQTVSGLKKVKTVRFRLNPLIFTTKRVLVLSGVEAVEWALAKKAAGRIEFLAVGPNIVVRADGHDSPLASNLIDRIIVPSEWVAESYYQQVPSIRNRLVIWPVGINLIDWPSLESKDRPQRRVVVYQKNADKKLYARVRDLVSEFATVDTLHYGSHTIAEYREALMTADAAVFLSKSESQGIALLESWAMNVPTLVWQPDSLEIAGWEFESFSSAPYLTPDTGAEWTDLKELKRELEALYSGRKKYTPRRWVEGNMTDSIQAEKLANILYDNKI